MPKVVTAKVAARIVGLSESTLAKLRLNGNGPVYCKLGRRVVYRPVDLDQWLQSRTARDTSDADARFLKALDGRAPALTMGYRHPNPRLAKIHRSYSVEECRALFTVHKNTVRNWLRQGLEPIDGQRPTVIRGDELRRFLTERRARAKQTCGPGRIYCLPCRAPKVPAGKMAECIQSRRHHRHASAASAPTAIG